MANFLAGLGQAIPAIEQMQHQEAVTDALKQQIAAQKFHLNQMAQEQERLERPIPAAQVHERFKDNPAALKALTDFMTSNNLTKNVGGQEFYNQRGLKMFHQTVNENTELRTSLDESQLQVLMDKEMGAFRAWNEAKASGDASKIQKTQPLFEAASKERKQLMDIIDARKINLAGVQAFTKAASGAMARQMFPAPHAPIPMEDKDTHQVTLIDPVAGKKLPPELRIPATARQQDPVKIESDTAKQPLPITDKGWTISTDKSGVNVAKKTGPDGNVLSEPYDPAKHGQAVAASEPQHEYKIEKDLQDAVDYNVAMAKVGSTVNLGFGSPRLRTAVHAALWREMQKGLEAGDLATVKNIRDSVNKSLNVQQSNFGMMNQFVKNLDGLVEQLKGKYEQVSRIDARFLDLPKREVLTRVAGSGSEQVISMYLYDISNDVNKLSQGSQQSIQQLGEESAKKWDKIHDPNLSLKEIMTVLESSKQIGHNRLDTATQALDDTEAFAKSLKVGVSPQRTSTPPPTKKAIGVVSPEALDKAPVGSTKKLPNGKTIIKLKDGSWDDIPANK